MPWQNASPCTTPGCPELAPPGRGQCDSCRARVRASRKAVQAPYDTALWRDTSRAYLTYHPVCEWPECDRPAHDVDHIDGKGPAGPAGFDWNNLRALCKPHHSSRTASDSGFHKRR